MKKYDSATKVLIRCRLSYAHVWDPKPETAEFDAGKYTAVLLIPKNDTTTIKKIKAAIEAAKVAGKDKLAGVKAKAIKYPLKDAEEEEMEGAEFEDCMFLNVKSTTAPQIVNKKVEDIIDKSEVYSGCYCNVTVNFFAYNQKGGTGIGAGLGNIQKVKDGERLSGGATAQQDFEAIDDDDDDEDDDIF